MNFDFKVYHIRSINANAAERAVINQELKELYASLSDEERRTFNEELQSFLVKTMANIGDEYAAIKASQDSQE
ncbi:MAG: hypothetical protein QM669_12345 [Siphonobacter sp.]